jgi:hypothetical protein
MAQGLPIKKPTTATPLTTCLEVPGPTPGGEANSPLFLSYGPGLRIPGPSLLLLPIFERLTTSHPKIRNMAQGQGRSEKAPEEYMKYFEDWLYTSDAEIGS